MRVHSLSGETGHFLRLSEVSLRKEGREADFAVEKCAEAAGGVLLKLKGIDSPEEARKYSSWEVWVPRDKAAPLKDGEYYFADLCRCALVFRGERIGDIRSVLETGPAAMLEVLTPGGKSHMIPFVNEHIGEIDLAEGTVELKTEWLLQ